MKPYAVVIGGANADIGGTPAGPLVAADSNPGKVSVSLGGVGRNIAESMAVQGLSVVLLTALGRDVYAETIRKSCGNLGIDTSHCVETPDGRTSTYLYINDCDGDMALAIVDTQLESCVTPEYLKRELSVINGAAAVVADTNLSSEAMGYLLANAAPPVFVDPVSTVKAKRLEGLLGGIHTLKPNRLEAECLTGIKINDGESLKAAAGALIEAGLNRVFISCGSAGVMAADRQGMSFIPARKARISCTTGAGDAFTGGLVKAYIDGLDRDASAAYAMEYALRFLENK